MKKTWLIAALVLMACSSKKGPPPDATVSFEANGAALSLVATADDAQPPSANFVKATGSMTITFYVAMPPDTVRRPFTIQIGGFKGGTGAVHVASAVFNRKDGESHEYQYVAKNDALKLVITDFDVDDVPGTPMQEGTLSGTFEGEMAYVYPKKEGNAFTAPLEIAHGKLGNIKVSGAK